MALVPVHLPGGRVPLRGGGRWAALAGTALLLGGCAERRLVAAPAEPPGTTTWVVVWMAGALVAVVAGVLLTLPVWRRPGGSRLAAAVLALQAGITATVATLLAGLAVRTGQLVDRAPDEAAAPALVRISRVDGDADLFWLLVLTVVLVGGLLVALFALGARFAASHHRLERWLASGLLVAELLGALALAGLWLIGWSGWPYASGLLAVPVLAVALYAVWPRGAGRLSS